jgi:hypothetical protein
MKPTKGRMVLYTLADYDLQEEYARNEGVTRPAVIVETWGNETHDATPMSSAVNLQVFVDGTSDGIPGGLLWKTSALFSETPGVPGTWGWPPRVE